MKRYIAIASLATVATLLVLGLGFYVGSHQRPTYQVEKGGQLNINPAR